MENTTELIFENKTEVICNTLDLKIQGNALKQLHEILKYQNKFNKEILIKCTTEGLHILNMSPCNVCLNSILIKTSLFNEFKINNAFDIMINLTELNTILKNIKKDSMLTLNINNLTDISITLDFLKVTETINATDEKLGDF